jgi:hypothetical protein
MGKNLVKPKLLETAKMKDLGFYLEQILQLLDDKSGNNFFDEDTRSKSLIPVKPSSFDLNA